jgi:anti-sigma factor RsiW
MTPEPSHPTPEELFAYRDGELPADRRAVIEVHVSSCRPCRARIDRVSGLEASLKQRPDPVEGDYYAALSRSVLGKIGAREPAAREPATPEPAAHEASPAPPAVETPARDRRREAEAEEPRVARAPALPWAAVLSTMAAAAAVVVVVLMLFRQGPVQVPIASRETAPRAGPGGAGPESAATAPSVAPSAGSRAAEGTLAKDEIQTRARLEAATKAMPETGESKTVPLGAAASPYGALVRRYGLPDLWTEGAVSRESLLQAEPALRMLYISGRAGADSARVRLYLAEAGRLRYETAPDSSLYDTIVHHYWRAIRLAGQEPDVARIAHDRLQSFSR